MTTYKHNCSYCKYGTNYPSKWTRHCKTKKHKKNTQKAEEVSQEIPKEIQRDPVKTKRDPIKAEERSGEIHQGSTACASQTW